VTKSFRLTLVAALTSGLLINSAVRASMSDAGEACIRRFLAQNNIDHEYRGLRRLEAKNGDRSGWMEAKTDYSLSRGFSYEVSAQGGSGFIRDKILRGVLDHELKIIAQGDAAQSALALANYTFEPMGVDADGLANVMLSPKRKDRVLVAGTLFLRPGDGDPVRLQGRLAKSPSFWVKNVEILRTYGRIGGVIMPVALESTAEIRWFGPASLRMSYACCEIDCRPVPGS